VFRDELNRWTVPDGIVLRQILHGVHEQFLPVYVAWISSAFAAFIA
jgi:hypothetical protein